MWFDVQAGHCSQLEYGGHVLGIFASLRISPSSTSSLHLFLLRINPDDSLPKQPQKMLPKRPVLFSLAFIGGIPSRKQHRNSHRFSRLRRQPGISSVFQEQFNHWEVFDNRLFAGHMGSPQAGVKGESFQGSKVHVTPCEEACPRRIATTITTARLLYRITRCQGSTRFGCRLRIGTTRFGELGYMVCPDRQCAGELFTHFSMRCCELSGLRLHLRAGTQ